MNDGSTDGTRELLDSEARTPSRRSSDQPRLRAARSISAFRFALERDFDVLVTMDCDGQHEPSRIPVLLEAIHDCDIVSGSRYIRDFRQDTPAPTDRRFINATITREINARYGLNLTDAFCGFKAYRRGALEKLRITESGWGMPLQLWVQAARQGLRVKEIGVPRLYLDPNRAFGGVMNDPEQRLDVLSRRAGRGRARPAARASRRNATRPVRSGVDAQPVPSTDRRTAKCWRNRTSTRSRHWSRANRRLLDRDDVRIGGMQPPRTSRTGAARDCRRRERDGTASARRPSARTLASRRLGEELRPERPRPKTRRHSAQPHRR